MYTFMRTIALALAIGAAGAALAGDAYYDVPIHELKLDRRELAHEEGGHDWRPYEDYARLQAMQPYAALDGQGEVYVAGQGEPTDTWYSPYMPYSRRGHREPMPRSVTPASASTAAPGPRHPRLHPRPEGKDVTGRLFVPNADLTGMVVAEVHGPRLRGESRGEGGLPAGEDRPL